MDGVRVFLVSSHLNFSIETHVHSFPLSLYRTHTCMPCADGDLPLNTALLPHSDWKIDVYEAPLLRARR